MGGGGAGVGLSAEAELDVAEELLVGGIDEGLGQASASVLGGGPELVQEGAEAGFAVLVGRRRSWVVEVQHGCRLEVEAEGEIGFRTLSTAYADGCSFPPNFLNCSPLHGHG